MGRQAGATPSSRGVILQYCPPCEGLVVRFSYMKNQDDLMHKVSGIHQAHNEVRIEQVGSNLPIINLNSQWLPRVYQPRGDCFKNAGSPCRMNFWVILNLIQGCHQRFWIYPLFDQKCSKKVKFYIILCNIFHFTLLGCF